MSVSVSEARPTVFSNWGDSTPTPSTTLIAPSAPLQQACYTKSNFPAAEHINWLFHNTQRWIKNLDVRAPRMGPYNIYVGDQSGAHYTTLTAAIAAALNGQSIYVSLGNLSAFLSASITVNKSVKIFFEPGSRFYKSNVAATRALIITSSDVEIHGAEFSSGWSAVGDAAIEVTGSRCVIKGCKFDPSITECVKETGVASGQLPMLIGNMEEN